MKTKEEIAQNIADCHFNSQHSEIAKASALRAINEHNVEVKQLVKNLLQIYVDVTNNSKPAISFEEIGKILEEAKQFSTEK